MNSIELRPAYEWCCDSCGANHFERALVPEMSTEEELELRQEHGIEVYDLGDWVMMPQTVRCEDCGVVYSTQRFGS